jgi:LmbE family N-acetylglucosaminyl deacetylase
MFRLLCVTAHPDDEAGGFGGSLLLYRARGVETHVLCLTPGQAASNRGGAKNEAELIAMRRQEFFASCQMLNVAHSEVLDYPDARLDQQDFRAVVADLAQRIRRLRPHVIMTIGPEGAVTGHPDHSMVALFTTAAYHWAGRENRFAEQLQDGLKPHQTQKLYYATALFTIPGRPAVALPPATAVIDIAPYLETKIAAFAAHTSQNPLLPFFAETIRKRGHYERFHLAAASTPRSMENETDLFAGVVD